MYMYMYFYILISATEHPKNDDTRMTRTQHNIRHTPNPLLTTVHVKSINNLQFFL